MGEKKKTIFDAFEETSNKSKVEKLKAGAVKGAEELRKKAVIGINNYEANRKQKQNEGIETFDHKVWRYIKSIGLTATLYRWRTNRKLKPYKQAEKEEKESIMATFDWRTKLWVYGIIGVVIVLILMWGLDHLEIVLPVMFGIWYIKTHITFMYNAKLFDYGWIFKIWRQDMNWQTLKPGLIFNRLPLATVAKDNQLEDYLENRGRKGMDSGQREYASITNSTVVFDERYGWIRLFSIDNRWFRKPVQNLEEVELTDYFLIPQRNTTNKLTKSVYFQVHGEVQQCVAGLIGQIDRSVFVDLIATDNYINFAFPEIAEQIEAKRLEQEAKEQAEKEARELSILNEQIQGKGLSKEVVQIIKTIRNNVDNWNFNVWNGNDNMAGNNAYFKVRCVLRNKKSVADIDRMKNTIEAELRRKVMIKPRQDKGAFDLVVLLDENLPMYALTMKQLEKYNSNGQMLIGNSLTGMLSTPWNYQANHFMVGGFTGSGKSVEILNILAQLVNISKGSDEFDYRQMFLTSSSKIGDFAEFDKAGALVVSGIEKQIAVFHYVLAELERREAEFYKVGVQNIKEFNKKFPDKKMKQLVLLADEWENTRQDLDKKLASEAEGLIAQILNIARSSGGVVITGSQSILKGAVGVIRDKMTVKISGFNEKNVLNQLDTEIADYYQTLQREPQGVFFYNALNLKPKEEYLAFGNTSFTLIQTPYISDISVKTLGTLTGGELADEIFGNKTSSGSDVNEVVEGEDLLI